MEEVVTLNRKEQRRIEVLNHMERGALTAGVAAELLGVTVRHVRRLLASYRAEGVVAIAHGNRGRRPWNALAEARKAQIVELAHTTYAGTNQQHMSELLAEREELHISRSALRRLLLGAGLASPRTRRAPRHRSRRERYSQEGMLLQIDGSRHDWVEGRGPYLTLIGAIDDATGKVPYALFREQEDAQGYFLLVAQIVKTLGCPLAVYRDRHGIFERSVRDRWTLEEQFAQKRDPTQFGRLLEELGIASIPARSPQAKGRVERLWGTFQDRLGTELRLAGARSLAEANAVLWAFLPRFNDRFAVPPRESGAAYRQLAASRRPEELFCFKYRRTVAADNTVQFGGERIQVLPGPDRLSYARVRVEVHERMDGSLAVYYGGRQLAVQSAPAEAPVLRARPGPRAAPSAIPWTVVAQQARASQEGPIQVVEGKPIPGHPWRRAIRADVTKSLNRSG